MRLKAQGMEFSVWVCKHAAQSQLKAMAPAVLQVGGLPLFLRPTVQLDADEKCNLMSGQSCDILLPF